MNPKEIRIEDFQRILFGEAPEIFLVETLIRTFLIYGFLLFILSWLGKRMSGQLSINEMAVMLVLGAIVSVPMQVPGSGLMQGVLLLFCTLVFQRGMSYFGFKSKKFEDLSMGKPVLLVSDGLLNLERMSANQITRQLIFAELRQNGISSLGQVERLYLEPSGIYSMYTFSNPRNGLSIYPPGDKDIYEAQEKAQGFNACKNCGFTDKTEINNSCPRCKECQWIQAVEPSKQ